jgi:hypothetical protein
MPRGPAGGDRGGAESMRTQRLVYADVSRRLTSGGALAVSPLAGTGADFGVWRAGREDTKRLVELKCAHSHTIAKRSGAKRWAFHAHGTAGNGAKHSLWSQCSESGAAILLLSWKAPGGARSFFPVLLADLTTTQRRTLRVRHLNRTEEDLEREFTCSQFEGCCTVLASGLEGALAALLPA